MSKVFDPAEIEAPTIRLLGAEFRLADLTRSRQRKLQEIGQKLDSLDSEGEGAAEANDEAARLLCQFLGVLLVDGGDVAERLSTAYDNDELGLKVLQRAQQFVLEWVGLSESVGEG